ncbi:helix-turn-helix domain-containing protein [Leucobacter sp. CSA2]|uniref:Helix-turn-helix domain-containing protein n=1 Tax=Leucobacter edaphi TaxID=2796472 RepID=A0A934UYS4_9MICO|nr:helix-turn-helix domain-containing protein [Leucobacter edaphi]MBK0422777.1 helix-turn-helix domain-containing protein [Leucobacter edaphi]
MSLSDPQAPPPRLPSAALPLDLLVRQLGEGVVTVLHAPESPAAMSGVSYFDSEAEPQTLVGQLILVTAHGEFAQDRFAAICAQLADAGACGIVIRAAQGAADPALLAACDEYDLELLALAPEIGWREFDALASRLLGEHGAGLQLGTNSGDRLFALANSIAQVFGGSVAIEDHRRNILAYSAIAGQAIDSLRANGILTRRTPDGPLNEIRYRQVFSTDGVSRFPTEEPFSPRAAVPLRAGNITLGSIWAIDPEGHDTSIPLSPEKRDVLLDAAQIAAGYIVDAWRFDHGDERSKETALRRFLAGSPHENDTTVLGIRPEKHYLVVAIESSRAAGADISELRTAASRHLSVYFPGSSCTIIDGRVIALVPASSTEPVSRSLERLVPELTRLSGGSCHCGIGEPRRPGSSFAVDAERAIRIAECAAEQGFSLATSEKVQPQLVLRACADALQSDALQLPETLALLAAQEAETHTTLLAWLEERGNAPRVAERLRVHEQTVRYRIRKAESRLGIDLFDPDRTLVLWLQLRLATLRPG